MAKRALEDFYIYQLNFPNVPANSSNTDSFNIQADSDFRWEKATYWANDVSFTNDDDISLADRSAPTINILITDTGSGRQLMDAEVQLPNIFGIGLIPFILQQPKTFSARSTVSVTLTNFNPTIDYNVGLSFIGSKIFNLNN